MCTFAIKTMIETTAEEFHAITIKLWFGYSALLNSVYVHCEVSIKRPLKESTRPQYIQSCNYLFDNFVCFNVYLNIYSAVWFITLFLHLQYLEIYKNILNYTKTFSASWRVLVDSFDEAGCICAQMLRTYLVIGTDYMENAFGFFLQGRHSSRTLCARAGT